ncbi:MAG: sulfite exporter TauE/SafE family protein [Magnetococcus sp. DMHC-6]
MHCKKIYFILGILILVLLYTDFTLAADGAVTQPIEQENMPWWVWALALFVVSFLLGIVAVLGGVGGGVLFVPIVSGFFFPFHLDFVRGAGLLVALAGALAAGPGLLKSGMANLRLAMPLALIASTSAIIGAIMGLALKPQIIQLCLGITILAIVFLMWKAKKSERPDVPVADPISTALSIHGIYYDAASKKEIDWKVHRTPIALGLFIIIGIMAGMFGLGAGWANVPVLNLVMGAPLKVSVATSKFMLSIVDTSAAWVYINQGAIMAVIAIPSILGIMMGSLIGVRLLTRVNAAVVRKVVLLMLLFAGGRALMKGIGM